VADKSLQTAVENLYRDVPTLGTRGSVMAAEKIAKEDPRKAREILSLLEKIHSEHENRVKLNITLAKEGDKKFIQIIEKGVREALDKEIETVVEVKPEIIGGLILEVNGTVIDNSLSFRVRKLAEKLKKVNVE